MTQRALVIDSDPAVFPVLAPVCAEFGLTADSAADAQAAAALFTPNAHRVVLVNPNAADLATLASMIVRPATGRSGPAVLLMRDPEAKPVVIQAAAAGVLDCLDKPLDPVTTKRRLGRVLQVMALEQSLRETEAALAAAWGKDTDVGVGTYAALQRALEVEFARARIRSLPLTCLAVSATAGSAKSAKELEKHHNHLKDFARQLQEKLRQADQVFRVDDAEFVVLLPGTPTAGARRVVKVVQELAAAEAMAVGAAVYPHPEITQASSLYRAANLMLVQAQLIPKGPRVAYFEGF